MKTTKETEPKVRIEKIKKIFDLEIVFKRKTSNIKVQKTLIEIDKVLLDRLWQINIFCNKIYIYHKSVGTGTKQIFRITIDVWGAFSANPAVKAPGTPKPPKLVSFNSSIMANIEKATSFGTNSKVL